MTVIPAMAISVHVRENIIFSPIQVISHRSPDFIEVRFEQAAYSQEGKAGCLAIVH
jgi:hypothetical protein